VFWLWIWHCITKSIQIEKIKRTCTVLHSKKKVLTVSLSQKCEHKYGELKAIRLRLTVSYPGTVWLSVRIPPLALFPQFDPPFHSPSHRETNVVLLQPEERKNTIVLCYCIVSTRELCHILPVTSNNVLCWLLAYCWILVDLSLCFHLARSIIVYLLVQIENLNMSRILLIYRGVPYTLWSKSIHIMRLHIDYRGSKTLTQMIY
jgi:hypothetical protein